MAVRLSSIDFSVHELDDSQTGSALSASPPKTKGKGGEVSRSSKVNPSNSSLLYNASEGNLRRFHSTTASLPSVSDIVDHQVVHPAAAQRHFDTNVVPPATVGISPHHYPSTGQIEPPLPRVIRRSRLSDLMNDVQNSAGLSDGVRKYLADADELILQKKNADAIPLLEAALLSTGETPRLQCLLWRLLGNAHLSLGHYKKASVCHMHQVAFCRELDDFAGMTMAECNLGIAYMNLGLLKLSGRCFAQYLDNSRVLMDEMGIAYACSNLGVLTKMIAVEEYHKLEGDDRSAKSQNKEGMEAFKENVRKAITYFEQHLEIVEKQADLEKQGRAYSHLGSCYEMLHQHAQAIFCHKKRLDIVRSTGDHNAEICTLCNLGNCLRGTGKLQEALDNYSLGLELCQATDNRAGESKILLNLGTTCQLLGQNQKAIEWYTLYYSMSVEANDLTGQARASGILAELYHCLGQETQAHEYFKKLSWSLTSIGDNDGANIAKQYVLKSKHAMQKQKLKNKTKLTKKGPLKNKQRIGMEKYLRASVEGSLDQLHEDQMIKSEGKNAPSAPGGGTWSPASLKKWYNVRLSGSAAKLGGSTWSHDFRKGLVVKNRHSYHEALKLSTQSSNLYRTRGMIDKLNAQEDLEELMKSVRPSFYTLGDFMEPIHHRVTSDEGGSVTEYEDIEDEENFQSRFIMPSAFGSARHIKDLKHVGKSLLVPNTDNTTQEHVPNEDRVTSEWLQWLDLHNVAPPTASEAAIASTLEKGKKVPPPVRPRPVPSVPSQPVLPVMPTALPQVKSNPKLEQEAPPPAPPPPPLPLQQNKVNIKQIKTPKQKKSFRGLSIFGNSTATSISQENLLENTSNSSSKSYDTLPAKRMSSFDSSLVVENRGIGEVPVTFRESQVI